MTFCNQTGVLQLFSLSCHTAVNKANLCSFSHFCVQQWPDSSAPLHNATRDSQVGEKLFANHKLSQLMTQSFCWVSFKQSHSCFSAVCDVLGWAAIDICFGLPFPVWLRHLTSQVEAGSAFAQCIVESHLPQAIPLCYKFWCPCSPNGQVTNTKFGITIHL